MFLNLLLNSTVCLESSPACFACTGWKTCPASLASLALMVLLNSTWKVKSQRVKVTLTNVGRSSNKVQSLVGHVKYLANILIQIRYISTGLVSFFVILKIPKAQLSLESHEPGREQMALVKGMKVQKVFLFLQPWVFKICT